MGPPSQACRGATSRSTGLLPVLRKPEQAKYLEGNQTATRDLVQTTFRWDQHKIMTSICS